MKIPSKIARILFISLFWLIGSAYQFEVSAEVPAGKNIHKFGNESEQSFDSRMNQIETNWIKQEKSKENSITRHQKAIEQRWKRSVYSNLKQRVDYNNQLDSRSTVNFEKGSIEIETILQTDYPNLFKRAAQKVVKRAQKLFGKKSGFIGLALENQVKDKKGNLVIGKKVEEYINKEVVSGIRPDLKPYVSRDGLERLRFAVQIDLVPEHLQIRARKYLPDVMKNSRRFNIKPQLILALMHTESYFNPLAVSRAGAIGLMQIMPQYAGSEAYHYLYGKKWNVRREYLYNSGINIELGTAYLYLLRNHHFKDIKDQKKNLYVSICAYNWGPNSVREKILDKVRYSEMSADQLFALLTEKTPKETSDHLQKVTKHMAKYSASFN